MLYSPVDSASWLAARALQTHACGAVRVVIIVGIIIFMSTYVRVISHNDFRRILPTFLAAL